MGKRLALKYLKFGEVFIWGLGHIQKKNESTHSVVKHARQRVGVLYGV